MSKHERLICIFFTCQLAFIENVTTLQLARHVAPVFDFSVTLLSM